MEITNSDIAQAWSDGQSDIQTIVNGIVPDTTLYTFIRPRFKFAASEDCDALYLTDATIYDELAAVDPNDVEISVELFFQNKFIQETICQNARVMVVNGKLTFVVDEGDGEYCARITMTYNQPDLPNPPIVWTETFDHCLTIVCCNDKVVSLKDEIKCRIASISCRIEKYACIGRKTKNLYNDMHRLQNILWCLCNFSISCNLYELYACDVNRIKSC
ncbi:MAG: hypothetical protein ACXADH_02615 [Candidatus Kariarchaeaceae archaeon]|jgi:hypothetical protein